MTSSYSIEQGPLQAGHAVSLFVEILVVVGHEPSGISWPPLAPFRYIVLRNAVEQFVVLARRLVSSESESEFRVLFKSYAT